MDRVILIVDVQLCGEMRVVWRHCWRVTRGGWRRTAVQAMCRFFTPSSPLPPFHSFHLCRIASYHINGPRMTCWNTVFPGISEYVPSLVSSLILVTLLVLEPLHSFPLFHSNKKCVR
ncbi:hypothetical protein BD309DRAFT_466872 [Dichomitus squalens]|nr:hypothetical protein BD309DRAFT_466872 [Dichomitus squalens]